MNKFKNLKKDFPIFKQKIKGKQLVYLDSAATSQKPQVIIDAVLNFYKKENSNIRRGLYPLAEKATLKVENVRKKVARFINAASSDEIIFVRNTTEAINLVAYSFMSHNIKKGDSVMATIMEHHSNFVPWQQLAKINKVKFEVLDFDENFKFPLRFRSGQAIPDLKSIQKIKNSKILAITHVSNVLGAINPIKQIINEARSINPEIKVLIDGAQAVPHLKINVKDLDADFYVFSGHKMLAGTGIGVLYGKRKLLEKMQPFLFGGEMVKNVDIEKTSFADLPYKFEAGTPDISGIISIGAAIDYLEKIGMEKIQKYEESLVRYCFKEMKGIKDLTIYGKEEVKGRLGVIAFNIEGIHPHDVAQILADEGICIRAGHHCAQPLHQRLGVMATARVSFYFYNDKRDIDKFINGLKKVKKIFTI